MNIVLFNKLVRALKPLAKSVSQTLSQKGSNGVIRVKAQTVDRAINQIAKVLLPTQNIPGVSFDQKACTSAAFNQALAGFAIVGRKLDPKTFLFVSSESMLDLKPVTLVSGVKAKPKVQKLTIGQTAAKAKAVTLKPKPVKKVASKAKPKLTVAKTAKAAVAIATKAKPAAETVKPVEKKVVAARRPKRKIRVPSNVVTK